MRPSRFLSYLLSGLLMCSLAAQAPAESIKIVTGELAPYAYTQDGKQAGLATDIVDEIKHRIACKTKTEVAPGKWSS
ncbi:MAG: hypothetical protein KGL57_11320 [Burkholderiales bacterium]|nr:hypothetical protein [Burkholderiales bacterium]